MLDNTFGITCPTNCTTVTWGAIPEYDIKCLEDPELSAVNFLTLGIPGVTTPPADWSLPADWAAVINNTDATGAFFKRLPVSGEIAENEAVTYAAPGLQTGILKRVYTGTFTITYLKDSTLYDYLRTLQCGTVKPLFYYEDVSKYMYGTNDGIIADSVDVQMAKGGAEDSFNQAVITITWEAKVDPERITSPLQ